MYRLWAMYQLRAFLTSILNNKTSGNIAYLLFLCFTTTYLTYKHVIFHFASAVSLEHKEFLDSEKIKILCWSGECTISEVKKLVHLIILYCWCIKLFHKIYYLYVTDRMSKIFCDFKMYSF